jgi:acetyl esterase/lipase
MVQVQGRADEPATPVAMPEFAVLERITPVDPMAERETRWGNPLVGLTDLVYATRPGYRPLRLDLYSELGVASPRPLVVVVHGGGWAHANPRVGAGFKDFPSVLAYLAQRGYVVASIEYRLSGEAPFPAQVEDLQAALRFLRAGAGRFGIDPDRIALWGLSAGAQIAALHATSCSPPDCVRALAGWFGVYDLAAYVVDSPSGGSVQAYLRCAAQGCPAAELAASSPIRHVDVRDPPTLLVHGLDDKQVMPSQSQRFAEALLAADVDTQLLLVPDVGHGLIGQDAATTSQALRQALAQTVGFLDQRLQADAGP